MVRRSWLKSLMPLLALVVVLASCGGDNDGGKQVSWIEGTPPPSFLADLGITPTGAIVQPTQIAVATEPATSPAEAAQPTAAPTATTPPVAEPDASARLTADQLDEFQPNELGEIPILEYHAIVTDSDEEAQFARTVDDFRSDLQWLYDNNFYVVPLADVVLNRIAAPAGKHPVAITFDDSYANQFRFIEEDDGSLTIDPESAVGIMEAFFAAHPDFGRTAFFAILPSACFDWTATVAEPDQTPLCDDKITWLLDNGYEVGNHTLNHQSLYDVEDDVFTSEIGGAIAALQEFDPRVEANIIAMTFGDYPDLETRKNQREMLRNGFEYEGEAIRMIGCLMVGANPTVSPVSTEWDPVFIARIQAFDADAVATNEALEGAMTLIDWFGVFKDDRARLYTSDGNPATITVPEALPPTVDGTLNENRIAADGLELIRY